VTSLVAASSCSVVCVDSRLKSLLDSTGGTVVVGGKTDEDNNYVAPTLVVDVPLTDSLMKDEVSAYVMLVYREVRACTEFPVCYSAD